MTGIDGPYYWDSNLFSAWLQAEKRPEGEMEGLNSYVEKFDKGQLRIITSTLTITEVLGTPNIPAGIPQQFDMFLQRPNVHKISVDAPIARMARDIRLHYLNKSDEFNGKTISTPDAIHVATAIIYNAIAFHTFDSKGYRNSLGLIPLSGDVAGHNLKIEKPLTKQVDMLL